jgi:hypothetical protein
MRAEIGRLQKSQEHSMRVFEALASNHQTAYIIEQLQNRAGIDNIARSLESSASPSTFNESLHDGSQDTISSTPFDAEDLHEVLPTQRIKLARYLGEQMILDDEIDSQDPRSHHGSKYTKDSWTTVTSDRTLAEHLLALYFCWEYPIFATVSKEHFMEDFRNGDTRYCSSLLVNALLALGCRYSDKLDTRRNLNDRTTAGDAFFTEALKLFKAENDHHVLTTIQALGIMSIREASCGRISESNILSVHSIQLVFEMGLHLDIPGPEDENDIEKTIRTATFWGALSLNE